MRHSLSLGTVELLHLKSTPLFALFHQFASLMHLFWMSVVHVSTPGCKLIFFTGVSVHMFSQMLIFPVLVSPLSPIVLVCTSKYWTLSFQRRGDTPVWCTSLASFVQAITCKNDCVSFCCVCRQMKPNISVQALNYLWDSVFNHFSLRCSWLFDLY